MEIASTGCFIPAVLRKQESPDKRGWGATDHRSNAYKRRKLSLTKGTDAMIELIKEPEKAKLPADYVLFDRWFPLRKHF